MRQASLRADILCLVTALIWGFAFVAQRMGMDHIGPMAFNGIRFALGAMVLAPLAIRSLRYPPPAPFLPGAKDGFPWLGGLVAGGVLFAGATLQQVGMLYTTAGKAGFITGLYVVLVPLLGLFFGQKAARGDVIGAVAAAVGLYFLSVTEDFTLAPGDGLELIGAVFWAGHVLVIGWLSPRTRALPLALAQYAVCSLLSLVAAVLFEDTTWAGVAGAGWAILYGGILSVGVAYTLQVVAQRDANPTHAAVLLSFETVFAAVGGALFLDESLGGRGLFGCCLMFAGMLAAQLWPRKPASA
ncbi:MAG: putative permease, DMT superfamily [Solidesulfovibrio magneticus str. Maddingley MBC34]|uniref:Putative permease, DMT superfamily n=1 Tax=Solidesulfovibrio magneticus str. Maddingley MBC34 TaxID=1206767 RepID=K6HE51_9BACT|nr:MAG: putative permease, DMT superfamily [Solidesulfovibrio magneticus str. Maddingley MBC34]